MLMSVREVDVLRLICWCQYVPDEKLYGLISDVEVHNLKCLGLIKQHEKSGAFVLTTKGLDYIKSFLPTIPKLTMSYHAGAIERRLRLARLTLTAYRAGIDVFTVSTKELFEPYTMFLTAIARSRGANPWGSTRIAAIAHVGDALYAMHYVCPGIGRIALMDELTAFSNQTAQFRNKERAFFFTGESYESLILALGEHTEDESKLIHYGDAYQNMQMPVHLLALNDTGAKQLRLMSVPDYRIVLTKAALKGQYSPPPEDVPFWDAFYLGMPFVMAADMDLKRIDKAWEEAKNRNYDQIVMVALEEQAESLLISKYRDTGKARVFTLTQEALNTALGEPLHLYSPLHTQFLTGKGEPVDAPFI